MPGGKLVDALSTQGRWTIEIVKRSDKTAGFSVLPRRWVIERTLAWLSRNRRLAKDFEASIASAKAWLGTGLHQATNTTIWHPDNQPIGL